MEFLRSKAFVQLVGVSADRPAIDQTGIIEDIDYDILISAAEGNGPDAVIDQLELKLEPAKNSIGIPVLDKADKPSVN
jgi:hypothetical protein